MLDALARSSVAKDWNSVAATDAPSEEVLILLCVKVLAASENNFPLPDREPLWRCVPVTPENFLGQDGRSTRDLTSFFLTYNARPDGLKYRLLSLLFLQNDPVALYREFWKRTVTVRELAEHWQSGTTNDDGRGDARRVLALVLSVGLSLIDCLADSRLKSDTAVSDRSDQLRELFVLVYDGLREVKAIELFDQKFWAALDTHLLIRRALYEKAAGSGNAVVAAPLASVAQPTLSTMLMNIASLSQPFFDALGSLVRNGISEDDIARTLKAGGIDLPMLIASARSLNEIDAHRALQIETAQRIAEKMDTE
jgi:hypothetical protein